MKKGFLHAIGILGMIVALSLGVKMPAEAHTTGSLQWRDGAYHLYDANGNLVINDFVFDGEYTYYAQADGTPMKDRLTYHPDGEHIIYFDEYGHEVFSAFQYCESVGYTCYFDSQGYIYKDQITFVDGDVVYLNANGKVEDSGWFQFANGVDYGYANEDGTLKNSRFDYDASGRVVYYHWNGMVARGLISDGLWYYSLDTGDGHYLGRFKAAGVASSDTYELQVLDLVNEERLSRNIAPLKLNTQVQQAAQVRAVEICSYFSHTRPDGRSCFSALDEYVTDGYWGAGENIAAGQASPQEVMNAWMNSPGHKANILKKSYTEMGIGYYYKADSMYKKHWVQMFISR
ncbi:CAP domain-containing protein [Roseburia sp. 499]|uniref:CAP domain-containing protein n=1 Tax=Roseburia sp. 499 TaxID=1261634 RepID=UPI0009520AAF|nr:CAP domain-containing protein [Roseburia sp. 499]WVK69288.1 CAP domain-containing protein [Roseburia sp. 499]